MIEIEAKIRFEYAHRLPKHRGKCRNVHGHSGEAIVVVAGPLDENGFVMDFADLKGPLKKWIDANWDHAYLCDGEDAFGHHVRNDAMKVFTFGEPPTAEVMADHLYEIARHIVATYCEQLQQAPHKIVVLSATIRETCTGSATRRRS